LRGFTAPLPRGVCAVSGDSFSLGRWSDGLAEWTEGDTAFLSIAFSWKVDEAFSRACWYRAAGFRVRAGGPGLFTPKAQRRMGDVAELGGAVPDALTRHNPMATKASEGCPVNCPFCIVPAMEGREFKLLPDFTPRPVLTDNNLSALPAEYQQHIIDRYLAAGVPLLDANSGFEPKTFDEDVFERWRAINKGPWRFGLDETHETPDVQRVIGMLRQRGVSSRKIQAYVMIGREPFAESMERIMRVIEWGGEPYVQPEMKLNTPVKEPWVRHDWTERKLRQVARWANGRFWKTVPFDQYNASAKTICDPDAALQTAFVA
jgi:hypothetical protein